MLNVQEPMFAVQRQSVVSFIPSHRLSVFVFLFQSVSKGVDITSTFCSLQSIMDRPGMDVRGVYFEQRLIGELIGYSWSGVRPPSVRRR